MGRFGYYGFRLLVYLFSILPFWMVYKLSDFLFPFFYKLIHYRRRVVNDNLRKSFPEKSSAEIRSIARITNYPVFYFNIKKVKRGSYELTFSELLREPTALT